MSFPSNEQYMDALQEPKSPILDPLLASGRLETNSWGAPYARTGTFALTFKVFAGGSNYAFRCFQSDRPGMHNRYKAISEAICSSAVPGFVAFEYRDAGVRVNGHSYPAIRMDWAVGKALGEYVDVNHKDPSAMRALQQQLHSLATSLSRAGIAHGDIQSNNILVGPGGGLTLVDYDGMFVPSIAKLGAIETGHRNFQHPQRMSTKPFDATLDRFSFALLHTALGALAERPGLWSEFSCDNDTLILRSSDLADPGSSRAFAAMTSLPLTRNLAQRLSSIAAAPYSATPTFDDFLSGTNIPISQIPGSGSGSGGTSGGNSSNTPWYLDTDVIAPSTQHGQSSVGVADASDRFQCLSWMGQSVEMIGRVKSIKHGGSATSPYSHLILGTDAGGSVRIRLLAPAVRAFIAAHRPIDETWIGTWVSATGIVQNDGSTAIVSIAVTSTGTLQVLTADQARTRLTRAVNAGSAIPPPPAPQQPATNRERLATLSKAAPTPTPTTTPYVRFTSGLNSNATPPASPKTGWRDSGLTPAGALGIIAVALFVMMAILVAIAVSSGDGSSGSSGAGEDTISADTAVSVEPEPNAVTDMVGTCWAASDSDPKTLDVVDCSDVSTDFKATRTVDTAASCPKDSMDWDNSSVLCLVTYSPVVYETCFQPKGGATECSDGLSWTYSYCWPYAQGLVLEQFINGRWETAKAVTAKTSSFCSKGDNPYLVEFSRKASGTGVKKYRLYAPEGGGYAAYVEPITVTVREK